MTRKKKVANYPKRVQKSEWTNQSWLENDLSQSMTLTTPVNSLINFRDIPLYPTFEDIKSKPPTLFANKVKRPYANCEEYLDRFFRLMREDFTSSVRDAICFLKKPNKSEHERFEMQRLWHYENVQIQKTNATSLKTMIFRFETATRALQFDYESSKRFKNGALLVLTKDNYETFSLGIITDTFNLNRGIVGVDVVDFKEVNKWTRIDILEPSAFYEPYRYVLAVFQDMSEINFPMKNYIIYGWKQISPPTYLVNNSTYNINGIVFDILDNNKWPSANSLQMDINQYEALKGALTKEFTMIQGPPGTGKTYIGLEIVKIIIENMYKTKKLTSPILVVCMTNHALDQFLEGIWRTTKNIARFGCGTKSDILVNYVPRMSIARNDTCADIYVGAKRSVATTLQQENVYQKNIKQVTRNIGILSLSTLMEVLITRGFDSWFNDSYDLLSWLFYNVTDDNGINPVDFMKKNKLLSSWLVKSKSDHAGDQLYCMTLTNIKEYYSQTQCKLDGLHRIFNPDNNEHVLRKRDLEYTLNTIKTIEKHMNKHLKLVQSDTIVEYTQNINCNAIDGRHRWLLYYNWVHLYLMLENNHIANIKDDARQMRREVNKFKSIGFLKPVKNKFVIGMTTTAAARNRYLLKNLKCPIVIIEEAAEVLEPHIVASLSEHCKQLILIGDHKQLRPQTANHIMGQKYKLDVSLFERMVHNDIPSYILAEQHRMRPEIAGLVAPAIYPHLRNHPSVLNRPHVRGVASDVFCITHKAFEEKDVELSSFKNSLEGDFLVALADYLLKQGYYPEDITIMAMYNAQVVYITKLINNPPYEHLKEIRVSSVDGYQGEENEIVLLSLVRSNSYNSVGFLKTNNRVCVALSRARLGFYIAGNLDLLSRASKLWESIKKYLCKTQAIGSKLKLRCTSHNKVLGEVSSAANFMKVGSCKSICNVVLSCGHRCTKKCHADDSDHLQVKCPHPCTRRCSRNHKCKHMCYVECNNCTVFTRELGECGHLIEGQCHIFNQIKCNVKVKVMLECGHEIEKLCHKPSVCDKACENLAPGCLFRHACKNKCGQVCGPCTAPIPIIMYCGHTSQILCSQETNSAVCKTQVRRQLPCGHQTMVSCTEDVLNLKCQDKSHKNDNVMKTPKAVVLVDRTNVQTEEIVKNKIIFPCGHKGHLNVPNGSSINENSNPEILAKYCDKICSKKRECGHYCKAMCKDCPSKKQHNACHSCKRKKVFSLNTVSSIKFHVKDKKQSKKMIVDEVSNY
ncbi:NFX1-type zinc finger-containing protein 1-like [Adelges cooleyi]|uniref:NFX1-type zinc finger-containing protein 1-like n=1 Tax=Adelges cooleyi TaxID=133065 RepID=UPI002180569C|nr:NFX1-type zinc finger-containing protein 1-like [Adelges cooleyi]